MLSLYHRFFFSVGRKKKRKKRKEKNDLRRGGEIPTKNSQIDQGFFSSAWSKTSTCH